MEKQSVSISCHANNVYATCVRAWSLVGWFMLRITISPISLTCFREAHHAWWDKNEYWNWIEKPCQHHLASVQLLQLTSINSIMPFSCFRQIHTMPSLLHRLLSLINDGWPRCFCSFCTRSDTLSLSLTIDLSIGLARALGIICLICYDSQEKSILKYWLLIR